MKGRKKMHFFTSISTEEISEERVMYQGKERKIKPFSHVFSEIS